MLKQPVKQGLPKHPVSPKGLLEVLIRLVQSQQNHFLIMTCSKLEKSFFNYDLFKVSKMTIFNYELFKVSDSSVKQSSPGNF